MAGAERRQSRGHKFARYAADFIVMVKSANAAIRARAAATCWRISQNEIVRYVLNNR